MALTLVIVSFSCTGIVAGQLLSYLSSEGIAGGPIAGMFGFGTGFGIAIYLTGFVSLRSFMLCPKAAAG
jgi:thiol:disulfide interchange protein DsbD